MFSSNSSNFFFSKQCRLFYCLKHSFDKTRDIAWKSIRNNVVQKLLYSCKAITFRISMNWFCFSFSQESNVSPLCAICWIIYNFQRDVSSWKFSSFDAKFLATFHVSTFISATFPSRFLFLFFPFAQSFLFTRTNFHIDVYMYKFLRK